MGICDIVRRIIARSVLSITQLDLLKASGSLQLCAGQIAGVEAGIHAVRSCFNEESTEEVLLVDATNAFNFFNRNSALLNIHYLCLAIATVVISCYREPADLFVGGTTLKSPEGTTQCDSLAILVYALATAPPSSRNFPLPLIRNKFGMLMTLPLLGRSSASGNGGTL